MKVDFGRFVAAFIFVFLLIFCIGASVVIYRDAAGAISKNFEEKMSGVGEIVSSFADVKELEKIMALAPDSVKNSPQFKKYHDPLRRTLLESGASFLYIYKFGGKKDILYCVDAEDVENEIWAPPNNAEVFDDDDLKLGLFSAFRQNSGITDIVDSPEWGLMRSGAYPVSEVGARGSFMTGIDFNLSEIVQRSVEVFTNLGAIFALIAIIAIWGAMRLARSTAECVDAVRVEALKIGAGQMTKIENKKAPAELRDLAQKIESYAKNMEGEISLFEQKRRKLGLEMLESEALAKSDEMAREYSFKSLINSADAEFDAVFKDGNFYVFEFFKSSNSLENALKKLGIKRAIYAAKNPQLALANSVKIWGVFDKNAQAISGSGELFAKLNSAGKTCKIEFLKQSQTVLEAFKNGV